MATDFRTRSVSGSVGGVVGSPSPSSLLLLLTSPRHRLRCSMARKRDLLPSLALRRTELLDEAEVAPPSEATELSLAVLS